MQGIYNVLINGEEKGCVVFGNKIEGVYKTRPHAPAEVEWINGKGCELYPAGIDIHTHDRWGEPEREDPEHFEAACIAGGVGTAVGMPNTKPPYEKAEQTEARLAGYKQINFMAWMACTRANYFERAQAFRYSHNRVPGGKLMMASTNNPETLVDDGPSQQRILEENAALGCITTIHAEAEDLIQRNRAQYLRMFGELRREHHCKIRNSEVETEGIRRILKIHKDVGGRIHIAHVSTSSGIKLILNAKDAGQQVTFESCPHYWMLNKDRLGLPDGGRYKMNPALRPLAEQMEVLKHFCMGDVDVSATDHAPHPLHLKKLEGLDECPSGVPGVETNIPLVYFLKHNGVISAARFIDLTSRRPAQILGLNKGELKASFDSDFILIHPKKITRLSDEDIKSKSGWTPFAGQPVNIIPLVVIGGKIVKRDLLVIP